MEAKHQPNSLNVRCSFSYTLHKNRLPYSKDKERTKQVKKVILKQTII